MRGCACSEENYDMGRLDGLKMIQRLLGDDIQRAQKAMKVLDDEIDRLETVDMALNDMVKNLTAKLPSQGVEA